MTRGGAAPLGSAEFRRLTGVSRETTERLEAYAGLLEKWQRRINLVGARTLGDPWRRHMLDSAQLRPLLPHRTRDLLDVGSGAGFPGLVLAILGVPDVHLVEADARKCAFLREAARLTGTRVTIHRARIEELAPWPASVITARALAPLPDFLDLVSAFMAPTTCCIVFAGERVRAEDARAPKGWRVESFPSQTRPGSRILRLTGTS